MAWTDGRIGEEVLKVDKPKEIIERFNINEHGYKKLLCPVCCREGLMRYFEEHMKSRHQDYLDRNKLTDVVFRFLEYIASSKYLEREKWVYYNWPELSCVGKIPDENMDIIDKRHYKMIRFAFRKIQIVDDKMVLVKIPYLAITQLIQTLMELKPSLTQRQACQFIKRCVDEKVLTCDGTFYELVNIS